jgi:hypothetical protein
LIPAQVFAYEKPYLKKLPAHVPAPYLVLERGTDQYGYAAVDGNYYWIPGTKRHDVKVLQYAQHLMIYRNRKLLGRYQIPPDGVKNKRIPPEGQQIPPHMPKNRKRPTTKQEKILRESDKQIDAYLTFAIENGVKQKHRFIRALYGLYRKMALDVFITTVSRALTYRITDIKTVERIATLQLTAANVQLPLPQIDRQLEKRDAYIEGYFADEVDLSVYDNITGNDDG